MTEPKYSTVCVMTPGGDVWLSKNVPEGQEYYAIVAVANTEKDPKCPWFRIPTEPKPLEPVNFNNSPYESFETIIFERGDQIRGLEFFKEQEDPEDDEEFEEPDYDCTIK